MSPETILREVKDQVATLVLNRPAKKNALTPELIERLLAELKDLEERNRVRALVIRGSGKEAFCAGYDIGALPVGGSAPGTGDPDQTQPVEALFESVRRFPYPVIAMLNGHAFGAGYELAVCCDIRIAADDVRVGMPSAKLGLVYPWTGLKRFVTVIGFASSRHLFFSGRAFAGDQLEKMGLADIVLPQIELEAFTYQLAAEIAANAPLALRGTKRIFNLLQESDLLDARAAAEAEQLTANSFASRDLKEGRKAFLEKRKPAFEGR